MKPKNTFRRGHAKFLRGSKAGKGKIAVLSVLVCLAAIVSAVTLAYLIDRDQAVNTFTPAFVDCEVRETFEGNTKSNVKVENTGNTSAYIRAAVVVNWVGNAGTEQAGKVYYQAPIAGTDYSIAYGTGWTLKDGYYYYNRAVDAGSSTGDLITTCTVLRSAPAEGYYLTVEIVAEAIQSVGTDSSDAKPVVLAWGVDPEQMGQDGNTQE